MLTVHKYALEHTDYQTVQIPEGSGFLHFAEQHEILTVWMEVDTSNNLRPQEFIIVGTGRPVPADVRHLESCFNGPFVWHLYAPNRDMLT